MLLQRKDADLQKNVEREQTELNSRECVRDGVDVCRCGTDEDTLKEIK
jgi:hypothetical protein